MAYNPGFYPGSGYPFQVANELINNAANLGGGTPNPPYLRADFLAGYPQFVGLVPDAMLDQFITLANGIVQSRKWGDNFPLGMGLVTAHFCTMFLQTTPPENGNAAQVVNAGRPVGVATSESVDGLSISYDLSFSGAAMKGWDVWKSTTFGAQFVGIARMMGVSTAYIW